jgi:hypothetical protein
MTAALRELVRRAAARWVGERVIPIGGVAQDRRLLRRALAPATSGRVLVVGPSLAARQALAGQPLDVVGTSPYAAYVTVCSSLHGPGSLPEARWDTVVVTQVDDALAERLRTVRPACRPGARILVLERHHDPADSEPMTAISSVASVQQVHLRRHRRLWVARVPA